MKPISYFWSQVNRWSLLISVIFVISSCTSEQAGPEESMSLNQDSLAIISVLDELNQAAAEADFNRYFDLYREDAVFTGTEAGERWHKNQFMDYARPYFEKGKAWNFRSIDRHIYIHTRQDIAWFDELLLTQMKLCRGSGVLVKENDRWKIQQYILSITVPNDVLDQVIPIKANAEDSFAEKILKR
ncbi:MAG: nuclear transport factor 2 family protein [Taibaiella sp.]|nr:nuclear transport factor 2 family protein [Taibaiella sp.]